MGTRMFCLALDTKVSGKSHASYLSRDGTHQGSKDKTVLQAAHSLATAPANMPGTDMVHTWHKSALHCRVV